MVQKIKSPLKERGTQGMTHDKKNMLQTMQRMKSKVTGRRG